MAAIKPFPVNPVHQEFLDLRKELQRRIVEIISAGQAVTLVSNGYKVATLYPDGTSEQHIDLQRDPYHPAYGDPA